MAKQEEKTSTKEKKVQDIVANCTHAESVRTPDGYGAYCFSCGETLE